MYASRLLINTEIEEIMHFCDALQPDELTSPIILINNNDGRALSPIEAAFAGWTISSIHDLQFTGDGKLLCILASVLKVIPNRGWFYDSCKKCAKKLEADGTVFYCSKCDTMVNASTNRASNWNTSSSFTVQHMTCDPSLTDSFTAYHKAREVTKNGERSTLTSPETVDLTGNDDIEDTPVQLKTSLRLDIDGIRLSFADSDPSTSSTSSSTGKRVLAEVVVDDPGSDDELDHVGI
ncbi:replication protein A 70 kDa DNA-binding subunit D-like [Senna tora]|uniref:Replication protein A 70 kDa DNA-binding subunit D-like n=1 Tax=Senna tora TaxID=362788 RepID=A0A834WL07_9FABA|nr:replication protein A 70 kDa DNA-binding subunit D-like [Senna tora]